MVAKIDQQGMYKRLPAIVVLCYFLATLDKILFTACSFSGTKCTTIVFVFTQNGTGESLL